MLFIFYRKRAQESKILNYNASAAATIASEDEDYKHMEDVEEVEEDLEPVRRREYVREPDRRQRPRKAAWREERVEERFR